MKHRSCKQCSKDFEQKREDHFFCSAKCVAAFYRDNPNPEYIHAQKERVHTYYCEECGVPFEVNDYAKRGGKRTPKYHSTACKQAAYRARGKATQQQAARRGEQQQQPPKQSRPKAAPKASKRTPDFWDGHVDRWTAACYWVGVDNSKIEFTKAELTRAWKKAMKREHPDISKSPDATWRAQAVNWAYDYLVKRHTSTVR